MENHPLIEVINKTTPFEEEDIRLFLSVFQEKKFKKNTLLLEAGKTAHEAFFVIKGALRQYYINEEGNERVCYFAFENEFLTDLESFSRQIPATSFIITQEETTCLVTSCTNLANAMRASENIATFFKVIVENVATESMRRTKSLLSFSPEKQFLELIQEKPQILQRIPQRYIAQYLGIAPESLSRIRKRLIQS